MTDPEQLESAPESMTRPAAPAMTELEIAMVPEPKDRITGPDGCQRYVWAGPVGGPYPEGDDPAEAVWQAAGCRDEPKTCPCGTSAQTPSQELVSQVSVAPLASGALRRMSAGVARGSVDVFTAPTMPALRSLAGPVDLDVATVPADIPTALDRPVMALSGQEGLAMLAQVWADAAAETGTLAVAEPVDG